MAGVWFGQGITAGGIGIRSRDGTEAQSTILGTDQHGKLITLFGCFVTNQSTTQQLQTIQISALYGFVNRGPGEQISESFEWVPRAAEKGA